MAGEADVGVCLEPTNRGGGGRMKALVSIEPEREGGFDGAPEIHRHCMRLERSRFRVGFKTNGLVVDLLYDAVERASILDLMEGLREGRSLNRLRADVGLGCKGILIQRGRGQMRTGGGPNLTIQYGTDCLSMWLLSPDEGEGESDGVVGIQLVHPENMEKNRGPYDARLPASSSSSSSFLALAVDSPRAKPPASSSPLIVHSQRRRARWHWNESMAEATLGGSGCVMNRLQRHHNQGIKADEQSEDVKAQGDASQNHWVNRGSDGNGIPDLEGRPEGERLGKPRLS
ncbi:hypothetical protein BKA70DRAFT_1231107 [Coprinopsis sp. MPI-PUGE-AT-0042]|nr:hypothetical protein BKA70DRAFT_1231107 [Coprinopsis sp. MPI-PUGE-AT-0042]